MKLYSVRESHKNRIKRRKATSFRRKGGGRRFYSQLDMSIVKHDIAVRNAQLNRGEIQRSTHFRSIEGISECGCGAVGCFVHY